MKAEDNAARTYTRDDWSDLAHTGPGTLAGRYLRLFWQPVARSQDLAAGRARPVRVMGQDFTLYRGEEGVPHIVGFRCAHRGTQLSTGWVEGDNLRCFYHGWTYDSLGRCVEQPAEPNPFCDKIRIQSYPTEEYLGLIFAYLGEGESPPLPSYPPMDAEGVREVETYTWPCNYLQTIENDPVHGAFVHRKQGTPKGSFFFPRVSFEECEWGVKEERRWVDGEFRVSYRGMPNIHYNASPGDGESGWVHWLAWAVPVDDECFTRYQSQLVRVSGAAADRRRQRYAEKISRESQGSVAEIAEAVLAGHLRVDDLYNERTVRLVFSQDYVAQVGQGTIVDRNSERLGQTDRGVIIFRKLFARELKALAEGRPITRWTFPDDLRVQVSERAGHTFMHVDGQEPARLV